MQADELNRFLGVAEEAADVARWQFVEGLGAAPALYKSTNDFATEVDLQIETTLRKHLVESTGIPVLGEEKGGQEQSRILWVVDPIDGTANFSSGNPNCAVLISLVVDEQPVVAVTDLPLLNMRLTAVEGARVTFNGTVLPRIDEVAPVSNQIGLGSVGMEDSDRVPPDSRLKLLKALQYEKMRPRISGSVGLDLAFVAQGIFEAAVSFSPFPWDNAAGVLLSRCAGAVVTDIDGEPWSLGSLGVIAGSPDVHETVLRTMKSIQRDAGRK